jgi:hypothetical protein
LGAFGYLIIGFLETKRAKQEDGNQTAI